MVASAGPCVIASQLAEWLTEEQKTESEFSCWLSLWNCLSGRSVWVLLEPSLNKTESSEIVWSLSSGWDNDFKYSTDFGISLTNPSGTADVLWIWVSVNLCGIVGFFSQLLFLVLCYNGCKKLVSRLLLSRCSWLAWRWNYLCAHMCLCTGILPRWLPLHYVITPSWVNYKQSVKCVISCTLEIRFLGGSLWTWRTAKSHQCEFLQSAICVSLPAMSLPPNLVNTLLFLTFSKCDPLCS